MLVCRREKDAVEKMGSSNILKVVFLLALCCGEMTTAVSAERIVHGIKAGDVVLVNSDKQKVIEMQRGHGGWNDDMTESLGKIGKVEYIDGDNDARVKVCKTFWYFNPEALTKLSSTEDGILEISTDKCVTGPELEVTKKRLRKIGRIVDMDCTVRNNPYTSSYVRWVKEGLVISRDATLAITNPRISVMSDSSKTFTLQIDDIKLDDAGVYACELQTNNGSLLAAATVELVVQSPPVISENSTRFLVATEGEGAQLECNAEGEPEPEVTWHRVFKESIAPIEDLIYTGSVLEIAAVRQADGGDYYCVAANGAGRSARRDVHLVVVKPGEVYTGRPLIDDTTATVVPADSVSPLLAEQLQLYAEKITNSTGEIRLQVEGFNKKLKAIERGLQYPETCKDSAVATNRV